MIIMNNTTITVNSSHRRADNEIRSCVRWCVFGSRLSSLLMSIHKCRDLPDLISIRHFGVWKYGPHSPSVFYRLGKSMKMINTIRGQAQFSNLFKKGVISISSGFRLLEQTLMLLSLHSTVCVAF